MNTQHTPEPWKIIDYYQRDIGQSHNCTVARMLNPPVGHSDANARRIVACVNAEMKRLRNAQTPNMI